MLARVKLWRRIAILLVLGFGTLAGGCGKAEYERRLKETTFELTRQKNAEEKGDVPAKAPAEDTPPAN